MTFEDIMKKEVNNIMDESSLEPQQKKIVQDLMNYYRLDIQRLNYECDALSELITVLHKS